MGKMVYTKDDAFKFLLEAVNNSTEEIYRLRKREISLLKQLLEADKKVTGLIQEIAEKTFPKEESSKGREQT